MVYFLFCQKDYQYLWILERFLEISEIISEAHTMTLHIGPFPGYFLDDKQYYRIVRMPSPVQPNCDAHDTIANGQYGAVWSMEHTQQVYEHIALFSSNISAEVSQEMWQQETNLPPAELWCAAYFLDNVPISCRRRTSNTTSSATPVTHSTSFKWFPQPWNNAAGDFELPGNLCYFSTFFNLSNSSAMYKII